MIRGLEADWRLSQRRMSPLGKAWLKMQDTRFVPRCVPSASPLGAILAPGGADSPSGRGFAPPLGSPSSPLAHKPTGQEQTSKE